MEYVHFMKPHRNAEEWHCQSKSWSRRGRTTTALEQRKARLLQCIADCVRGLPTSARAPCRPRRWRPPARRRAARAARGSRSRASRATRRQSRSRPRPAAHATRPPRRRPRLNRPGTRGSFSGGAVVCRFNWPTVAGLPSIHSAYSQLTGQRQEEALGTGSLGCCAAKTYRRLRRWEPLWQNFISITPFLMSPALAVRAAVDRCAEGKQAPGVMWGSAWV